MQLNNNKKQTNEEKTEHQVEWTSQLLYDKTYF